MLPDFLTSFSMPGSVKHHNNLHFPCVNVSDSRVYFFDCQRGGHISPRSFPSRSVLSVRLPAARMSTRTNWPTVCSFREGEEGRST